MGKRALSTILLALVLATRPVLAVQNVTVEPRLDDLLEPIRHKYGLPAMAGAIVTGHGLQALGAVGVRKAGTDVAVTIDDKWHLGSDTKAMTAAIIGALVERGKLRWETTLEDVFPDLARPMPAALQKVTLLQLLSHRAGLPANTLWGLIPRTGTTRDQRLAVLKAMASVSLASEPGTKFLYSNLGYVIAAAMAEQAADASWEDLMKTILIEPLGMASVGYGGLGTPGKIDQPWPHLPDGKPAAENGPDIDNPPALGPAGRVHCTLGDWAKFIADALRGARGERALLRPETYKTLQTPPFGDPYALGWGIAEREWGGGTVLTHAGSNTMNFAVAWLAPLRDFAVLVVTNQGGESASKACNEASSALVRRHLE